MIKITKEERHEIRKKEIVDAAKVCFARRGFHSTSVAVIAEAANINVGQLYRYFDSKETIIAAIADDTFSRLSAKIEKDGIQKIFESQSDENIILYGELYAEANRNLAIDAILAKSESRMDSYIIDFLRKKDPNMTLEKAKLGADIIATICAGIFMCRLRRKTFFKEHIQQLVSLIFSPEMIEKYKTMA